MEIGTPLNPRIEKICDVVHFHTARYSFATIKYRYSDWTESQIADAIGHADFKMTLENYICDRSPVSVAEKQKNVDDIFN